MRRLAPTPVRTLAAALLAVLALALVLPAAAAGAPRARVIVKFKPEAGAPVDARGDARSSERVGILAARRGLALGGQRALGRRVRLVTAEGMSSQELARRLAADPEVAYAVPDRRMRPLFVPDDPLYEADPRISPEEGQWYLREPDDNGPIRSSINAERAWDTSRGTGVVVAVLDTGVRFNHPDLRRSRDGGKLLDGYDFVRREELSNDGDGRDDDPSDPGDWVTVEEVQADPNDDLDETCVRDPDSGQLVDVDSSWHGTEVAGILGALTNNDRGMAGAGFNVRLLPVRVLGKCGGFSSDIVLAMRWAAGIPVEGVPTNTTPAKVLNLSLGGTGECGADYADAIADVRAEGVAVVVSAGNSEGHPVSEPGNCEGVITVAGLRQSGTKVGFSDLGPEVAISAPGGNCVTGVNQACQYPLLTTSNDGTRGPGNSIFTDGDNRVTVGTSFSAPLVSGTLALALAVRPELEPDDLRALVRRTAREFPDSGALDPNAPQCQAPRDDLTQDECYCTTDTCGAGMLDAAAAVAAAGGIIPRIRVETESPAADRTVRLSAADSLPTEGGTLNANAVWEIVDGNGIVDDFETTSGLEATVRPSAGGSFRVRVRVTDSTGSSASVERTVRVSGAREDEDDDWGSGALGGGYLVALLAAVVATRRAVRRGEREARPGR